MKPIEFNLPNEQYHRSLGTANYISSTQLKHYATSPAYYKFMHDHPELNEETPAMKLGSQLHEYMEQVVNGIPIDEVNARYVVFEPPVNPKTNSPYGESTAKYQEAYQDFLASSDGKTVISKPSLDKIRGMAKAILSQDLNRKLIEYAKPQDNSLRGPEISFFASIKDNIFAKCRTDALTSNKIIDWKTSSADIDPDSLANTILKFKYDVSAALYQLILWRVTGQFYSFYWIFVKNAEPYEATVPVSAENFAFSCEEDLIQFDNDTDCVMVFNHGVMEMRALLNEHIWCVEHNEWPGSEVFVEPNELSGTRILAPVCPTWAMNKISKFYH